MKSPARLNVFARSNACSCYVGYFPGDSGNIGMYIPRQYEIAMYFLRQDKDICFSANVGPAFLILVIPCPFLQIMRI
jgi:hypothetical protein